MESQMKIYFPPTPASKYSVISNYPYYSLQINKKTYPTPTTICFFHFINGKYINGYDQNGKRLFSILIPNTSVYVLYTPGHIDY